MTSSYPKSKIQALKQTFISRAVTSLHGAPPHSLDSSSDGLCLLS